MVRKGPHTSDTLGVAELECLARFFAVGASLFPDVVEAAGKVGDDIVTACEIEIFDLVLVLVSGVLSFTSRRVDFFTCEPQVVGERCRREAVLSTQLLERDVDNARLVGWQLGARNDEILFKDLLFV